MNRRLYGLLMTVAVGGVLLYCSCTPGPVAGTETGNPDITACLESALSLFDTTDRWIPSTYLIDGERQLSPDNVYTAPTVSNIAKRRAVDTTDDITGDVSVHYDTLIIVDTTFRHDTLLLETIVYDTVVQYFEEADTPVVNELIVQRLLHDSVFVTDTVVVRDTVLLPGVDTVSDAATEISRNTTDEDLTGSTDDSTADYRIERDAVTGAVVVTTWGATSMEEVTPPSFTVSTDTGVQMIARNVRFGGVSIDEVYRDGDGDGIMTTAASGLLPLLAWTGVYNSCAFSVEIAADFDAGEDGTFSTGTDNRIHSLLCGTMKLDASTELVRYGTRYFGQNDDTCFLVREVDYPWDSTARIVTRYQCRTGADSLNHRLNELLSCRQNIEYRSGGIRTIELTVVPDAAVTAGTTPESGILTAAIDFGKGLAGRIDAVVDYTTGSISGTYAQAGIEYRLYYLRDGNTIELSPLE